jgi:hypothetical protein
MMLLIIPDIHNVGVAIADAVNAGLRPGLLREKLGERSTRFFNKF